MSKFLGKQKTVKLTYDIDGNEVMIKVRVKALTIPQIAAMLKHAKVLMSSLGDDLSFYVAFMSILSEHYDDIIAHVSGCFEFYEQEGITIADIDASLAWDLFEGPFKEVNESFFEKAGKLIPAKQKESDQSENLNSESG